MTLFNLSHLLLPLLALLVVSVTPMVTSTLCTYPATLLNVKYHWRIMSPDYVAAQWSVHHFRRKVDFTATDMRMEYIVSLYTWRRAGRAVHYRCVDAVRKDTFLVAVLEEERPTHYTCVQFVFRSTNVVQLRLGGRLFYKTESLCDEAGLQLMDAPLVYYHDQSTFWTEPRNEQLAYKACPLQGGYVLTQWYENGQARCKATPAAPVSVKLENECERGEGLGLLGGSASCPPVYTGYPLYCLADWTHGEFTYMLLFRDLMDFDLLCMRYPTMHGNHFTAHLFVDGVCDTSQNISASRGHRRMELTRYADPTADVCTNDSPVCNEYIPPAKGCDRIWSSFCRHTCQTCPWRRPWTNVTIEPEFRGMFYKDTYTQGPETVTITDHHIDIPSLGKYQLFGRSTCVSEKHAHGMGSALHELVFLQAFDNGCSPRLVVIQLSARTPSVISIRMSISVNIDWQLFNKISKSVNQDYGTLACPTSRKFRKPPINIKDTFRTLPHGWFNLVRMQATHSGDTRPCTGLLHFKHIRMTFTSGGTCNGIISSTSERTFRMSLSDCQASSARLNSSSSFNTAGVTDFECVSTFKASVGRKKEAVMTTFVITKISSHVTSVFNETLHCWMQSTLSRDTLLLSKISDCDSNAEVYFFEYGRRVKHYIGRVTRLQQPVPVNFHSGTGVGGPLHGLWACWLLLIGWTSLFLSSLS